MRKTKIVCTLGPATDSYDMIVSLIKAGMNVARINMSHGTYEEHAIRIEQVKRARKELDVSVAIMLDTKGPEIRIGTFQNGKVELKSGNKFSLYAASTVGTEKGISITYPKLTRLVSKGDRILLNDGLISFEVESANQSEIVCKIIDGGVLSDRKSINLPDTKIEMPYISEADRQDFLFGISQQVDYFAISFVRTADDVKFVRELLRQNDAEDIQIISKIENREGVNNLADILNYCDGAMVARGDMGVEIPFEELPGIQKSMIKLCYRQGKKVITATQMLESMITNPRPTRAEISDVANAIYDGTSAIMLSGETAVGKYCIESVKTMAKIASQAESSINFRKRFVEHEPKINSITDAVSHSTVAAAYDLNAKAIITVTKSGTTARKVSRFRPDCIIIAATTSEKGYNQLALNWGVLPTMAEEKPTSDELFTHSVECAKSTGYVKKGDLVVITAGIPVGITGNTNTMRVEYIE